MEQPNTESVDSGLPTVEEGAAVEQPQEQEEVSGPVEQAIEEKKSSDEDRSAFNCPDCKGEGLKNEAEVCQTCKGTGKI